MKNLFSNSIFLALLLLLSAVCNGCTDDDISDCGDADALETWYERAIEKSSILTGNIMNSVSYAVLAYDCYDTNVLTKEFGEKFESLNGYTHPHMQHKYDVMSKLESKGLTYDYLRRMRLNQLSNDKKAELNILDWFSDENMNNENYMNSKIDNSVLYGHGINSETSESTCTNFYLAYYAILTSSFSIVSNVLYDTAYNTGLRMSIGYNIDFANSIEIGIAMSSNDAGIFFSVGPWVSLVNDHKYWGSIGFEWVYDDISGKSYTDGDYQIESANVGITKGYKFGSTQWLNEQMTFEFGEYEASAYPTTLDMWSASGINTELISIFSSIEADKNEKNEFITNSIAQGYTNVTYIHVIAVFVALSVIYIIGYFIFKKCSSMNSLKNEKYEAIV